MDKIRKIVFYIIVCVSSFNLHSQNEDGVDKKKVRLSVEAQSFLFMVKYKDIPSGRNAHFEIGNNSRIYNVQTTINVLFNSYLNLGLGMGIEKLALENSHFSYNPVFVNFIPFPKEKMKSGLSSFLNFGTQIGNLNAMGFLLRGGIKYEILITKNLSTHLGLSYSYQNLYKSFPNSGRPSDYYNIRSFGFGLGIEIF